MRPGKDAFLPVARYLRPEEAVVPFRGRPELDELRRWCASASHTAVRLVTGEGGAGKTRLALQLGEELDANGWRQLWVPRGEEREAVWAAHTMGQPCVLVVDYAETRSDLVGLLDEVAADHDGPDLRVVLLARSAGEWWQQLLASAEERTAALLEASLPVTLGPVRAAGEPQEVFDEALAAFARKLGVPRPQARLVLSAPDPVVLVVHAAALLAVVDYATGAGVGDQPVSGPQVLEGLLRHEARYWWWSAAVRGLHLDVSVLRLAVAVGCLIGADSETAVGAVLSVVPDLDSAGRRRQVARWLLDLYPAGRDARGRDWLGQMRPDRLAEQLIAGELARHSELIAPLFSGLSEARAGRALTVLARAALTQDRAVGLLRRALAADLDHLAVPALMVAVETNPVIGELLSQIIPGLPVSRQTLLRVAAESPYPSFALAAPAAVVLQRLADDAADDGERGGRLVDLSNRLGNLGRREEALAAIDQAVAIYRQLAQARPDAFLADLATSLNNQSNRLADMGRRDEALAAIEEAVRIRRDLVRLAAGRDWPGQLRPEEAAAIGELVANRPDLAEDWHPFRPVLHALTGTALPDLADSLNNQADLAAADLRRSEEAGFAGREAVDIRRYLAGAWREQVDPGLAAALTDAFLPDLAALTEAFLPDLAASLNNQSNRLAKMGQEWEALAAIEEAVDIRRRLAEARPGAFLPDLAMSLNNQSSCLADMGRRDEALAAIEEATAIYRRLAEARRDAFLPDLAMSLNNQSNRLADIGRPDEALAAIEEAVDIRRRQAEARPDAFLPDLAASLNNQSNRLADIGRRDEALAAIEEATAIYRRQAEARPDAFLPDLAMSLNNQSNRLADIGQPDEALAAIEEATAIYRRLVEARLDAFLPDLAMSLNNQSNRLADIGRPDEALAAIEEAVAIYRRLIEYWVYGPYAYAQWPGLAMSLNNQSLRLADMGRRDEALAAIEEAVDIRRRLADNAI